MAHHSTLRHTFREHNADPSAAPPGQPTVHTEHTYHPHNTPAKHTPHTQCSQDPRTSPTQHTHNAYTTCMRVRHIRYLTRLVNTRASHAQNIITYTHIHVTCAVPDRARGSRRASLTHLAHTLPTWLASVVIMLAVRFCANT